jgi:hypothetical protein
MSTELHSLLLPIALALAASTTACLVCALVVMRRLKQRYLVVLTGAQVLYDHAKHCPRAQGLLLYCRKVRADRELDG